MTTPALQSAQEKELAEMTERCLRAATFPNGSEPYLQARGLETPTPNFQEWLAHWGEKRLIENQESAQQSCKRDWSDRFGSFWMYPAWELALGCYWKEDLADWHSRWLKCGGRLFENGRMLAAKFDPIWERLHATFYDGLGEPYPPYARSSCAHWIEIGDDEAVVLGVVSEKEMEAWGRAEPMRPLTVQEREHYQELHDELSQEIHRRGGPAPNATRAERFAHERIKNSKEEALSTLEHRKRKEEADERAMMFRLMDKINESLRLEPEIHDVQRMAWLCESVQKLTSTPHFDSYPNWRANAWIASADLHRLQGNSADELGCLEYALTLNPKATVKRRVKALKNSIIK